MISIACGSPPRVWGNRSASTASIARTVHPHVCGEISTARASAMPLQRFTPTCVGKSRLMTATGVSDGGSPPRVWGNRLRHEHALAAVHPHVCGEIGHHCACYACVLRFTPTCVGKYRQHATVDVASGSPPRVWGNPARSHLTSAPRGSPPRVWGNLHSGADDRPRRFTPTCVGKSTSQSACTATTGSPPRVWGNPAQLRRRIERCTVHPHVCGENCTPRADRRSSTVHPHVCGEIALSTMRQAPVDVGSPPRVWGNLAVAAAAAALSVHPHVCGEIGASRTATSTQRFTPTCVGKSRWPVALRLRDGSPPRVWGNRHRRLPARSCGSPPRVWGNRSAAWRMIALNAVHPHVCGEIPSVPEHPLARPVHPHVCGEICLRLPAALVVTRFTPTCVGKSRTRRCASPDAVHPHVCGEIRAVVGQRSWPTVHPHVCGEIAASAIWSGPAVHPHVCGEIMSCRQIAPPSGSPPRVWGNLPVREHRR